MRVCEERSDELKRQVYWILTCMVDTSVRNVAAAKLYAVINSTNDPSIATRFARRRFKKTDEFREFFETLGIFIEVK